MLDDSFLVERERQARAERDVSSEDAAETALDAGLAEVEVSLLVRRARQADPIVAAKPFAALIQRFWDSLLKVCAKYFVHEAEDLAQEVSLKIWTLRERLDPMQDFGHYLAVVAKNHCLDRVRKEARRGPLSPQQVISSDAVPVLDGMPDPSALSQEQRMHFRDALLAAFPRLTPLQRFIVERRYAGFTVEDDANELECTGANVRYHQVNAVARLQEFFALEWQGQR